MIHDNLFKKYICVRDVEKHETIVEGHKHTISAEIITVLTRYRPIVLELI